MPRSRSHRRPSLNRKRCGTILAEEDIPCPKQIAQSAPRCRHHQREYSDSTRNYKSYAAQAQVLGVSDTMSPSAMKKLHSAEQVEDKLRVVNELILVLSEEIDGRIRHRYRFFNDVPDEGHNTRIEIQQDKLDKACDLKERLEERLGKLKNEERQRELHLRKQQELDAYYEGITSTRGQGCSCDYCSRGSARLLQHDSVFPPLPRTTEAISGPRRPPLGAWNANLPNNAPRKQTVQPVRAGGVWAQHNNANGEYPRSSYKPATQQQYTTKPSPQYQTDAYRSDYYHTRTVPSASQGYPHSQATDSYPLNGSDEDPSSTGWWSYLKTALWISGTALALYSLGVFNF